MSFRVSNPRCNPSVFTAPQDVTFAFNAQTFGGGMNIDVVYSAEDHPITLDGGDSVSGTELIDENDVPITRTITVAGSAGSWPVAITVTGDGITKNISCRVTLQ